VLSSRLPVHFTGLSGARVQASGGVPRKSPPTLNHSSRQQHSNTTTHQIMTWESATPPETFCEVLFLYIQHSKDTAIKRSPTRLCETPPPPSQPSTSRLLTKRSQFKTNITLVSADESLHHYSSTTEVCMRIELLVEPSAETGSNRTLNTRSSKHTLKTASHICANQEQISAVETDMYYRC
jgi:hypothetical protein